MATFDSHDSAWNYMQNHFSDDSSLVLVEQGMILVKRRGAWKPYLSCLGGVRSADDDQVSSEAHKCAAEA